MLSKLLICYVVDMKVNLHIFDWPIIQSSLSHLLWDVFDVVFVHINSVREVFVPYWKRREVDARGDGTSLVGSTVSQRGHRQPNGYLGFVIELELDLF